MRPFPSPSSDNDPDYRNEDSRPAESSDPVPIHDFHHYRRLAETQTDPTFLEIGGPGRLRQLWRWICWAVLVLVTAGVFVTLFYFFTNSFRIALVIVTGMLLYMIVAARLAEGRLDRRPGE